MATVAIVGVLATIAASYGTGQARQRAFQATVRAVVTATTVARAHALSTGQPACVNLDNGAIVAFVDQNNDRLYNGTDALLYRYPEDQTVQLSTVTVTSAALVENGVGPSTATFDSRGFVVESLTGAALHDSNVCVQDAQAGYAANVQLSRFGWAGVTDTAACGN